MKKAFLILAATTAMLFAELGNPGIARRERLDNSRTIVLVKNGAPKSCIVVPPKNENCSYAAKELQEFIRRSTGATLPIVDKAPDDADSRIFVGIAPQGFDASSLPRDAFIIKSNRNDIYICGKTTRYTHPYQSARRTARSTTAEPSSASMASSNASLAQGSSFQCQNANSSKR